jgi:hypothetical protein
LWVHTSTRENVRTANKVGIQVALQHADFNPVGSVAQKHHRGGITHFNLA